MMETVTRELKLPDELGHVVGKALEPYCRQHLEGHAHSVGMVVELYLATKLHNLSHEILLQTLYDVKENFPPADITCDDYKTVLQSISVRHDGIVLLRLLDEKGTLSEPERVTDELIMEGVDFYRESFGE